MHETDDSRAHVRSARDFTGAAPKFCPAFGRSDWPSALLI